MEVRLELAEGWRAAGDISRRVGTWPMRAMAFGGMVLEDINDAERRELGIGQDGMALRVEHVGQYGAHAAAKREGFQVKDVVVEVGGLKGRLTESAIIGKLLQGHRPGEKLPATVLRGTERVHLLLPQQ